MIVSRQEDFPELLELDAARVDSLAERDKLKKSLL
jgi:hypothetical protein